MPMKSAETAGLRRTLRRSLRRHARHAAMKVRKPRLSVGAKDADGNANANANANTNGHDQRLLLLHHLRQQDEQFEQTSASLSVSTASTTSSVSSPARHRHRHYIFGRYFDDNDRSAADILATLYYSGVLGPKLPDGAGLAVGLEHGSPPLSPVCDVALPSMQQTNIMLQSWHSECSSPSVRVHVADADADVDADDLDYGLHMADESPLTPGLSFGSSGSSARSSFSQPVEPSGRWPAPGPVLMPLPLDGPAKSLVTPAVTPAVTSPALTHLLSRPSATCEQSYFSAATSASRPAAMPSPPQSPTNMAVTTGAMLPPTPTPASRKDRKKAAATPKPHCNVKYETAELDFIMYQRCTKNRAWDDVTAAFNAALPRLRQYAEGEEDALAASNQSSTPGSPVPSTDRYRPRPERTTPGLQASYYRQRLALPLLDEAGRLVFDEQTGKQVFTEVMVRDDKSRRRRRRMGAGAGTGTGTGAGTLAVNPTGSAATASGKPGFSATKTDDTRVHLVLYFPERVAHYDYWFVTAEDKALARQRAYERNLQRAQRGLPVWHPGSDDPETGILIRNKE